MNRHIKFVIMILLESIIIISCNSLNDETLIRESTIEYINNTDAFIEYLIADSHICNKPKHLSEKEFLQNYRGVRRKSSYTYDFKFYADTLFNGEWREFPTYMMYFKNSNDNLIIVSFSYNTKKSKWCISSYENIDKYGQEPSFY